MSDECEYDAASGKLRWYRGGVPISKPAVTRDYRRDPKLEVEVPKDDRPTIHVHTDHSPDKVRTFYEIPDAIARRLQPDGDTRTFVQCLADLAEVHHG